MGWREDVTLHETEILREMRYTQRSSTYYYSTEMLREILFVRYKKLFVSYRLFKSVNLRKIISIKMCIFN